jgi:hypothetical protein
MPTLPRQAEDGPDGRRCPRSVHGSGGDEDPPGLAGDPMAGHWDQGGPPRPIGPPGTEGAAEGGCPQGTASEAGPSHGPREVAGQPTGPGPWGGASAGGGFLAVKAAPRDRGWGPGAAGDGTRRQAREQSDTPGGDEEQGRQARGLGEALAWTSPEDRPEAMSAGPSRILWKVPGQGAGDMAMPRPRHEGPSGPRACSPPGWI